MPQDKAASLAGEALNKAISAEMVTLYARHYSHGRTSATTYIHDDVVLCVIRSSLSAEEQRLVAGGGCRGVLSARLAFQERQQDEFTAAVERLTDRLVVAFLSANQTAPDIAVELFFLHPLVVLPETGP